MSSSQTIITPNNVLTKFEEIHKKYYYEQGYITCIVPDEIASKFMESNPQLIWTKQYNYHVSDKVAILTTNITLKLKGYDFTVFLDRPYKPDHHREFEDYFGFGGHCNGYTDKRIIVRFTESFDKSINIRDFIMAGVGGGGGVGAVSNHVCDDNYAKDICLFLIFGGYVKYYDGFSNLVTWFRENNCCAFDTTDDVSRSTYTLIPYIFDNYIIPAAPEHI